MKVFLTGATGYVGHQLALKLADSDYKVNALVRELDSPKIPKHVNINLFQGDICNLSSIESAIKNCEVVFHVAAYTNLKCNNIENFYDVNVCGTENLLKASLKYNIKRFVYTSTLSVFGPSYNSAPITENQPRLTSFSNDYELTKSMSEELVLSYEKKGLSSIILNLSRVYGPGLNTFSNGLNKLIKSIIKNDFLFVPSRLNAIANYVYINDVVDAHLLAITKGISAEKYIIGGQNLSYESLFEEIKHLTKSKIKIVKINFEVVKAMVSISSTLGRVFGFEIPLNKRILKSLFTNRSAVSRKAVTQLNYKITPFSKGMSQTINYLYK